eukprot:5807562-Lingulodinium_polyedra.AAC.2
MAAFAFAASTSRRHDVQYALLPFLSTTTQSLHEAIDNLAFFATCAALTTAADMPSGAPMLGKSSSIKPVLSDGVATGAWHATSPSTDSESTNMSSESMLKKSPESASVLAGEAMPPLAGCRAATAASVGRRCAALIHTQHQPMRVAPWQWCCKTTLGWKAQHTQQGLRASLPSSRTGQSRQCKTIHGNASAGEQFQLLDNTDCLLYTSPSPRTRSNL